MLCALWWLEVLPSQADDQLTQVNFYRGFWSIAQEVWSKKFGGMWHLISLAVRIKFKYPVGNVRSSVLFFVLINELFSCIDWEHKLLCTLVQLNHSWRLSMVGQLSPASFFNCSVSLLDNERICLTGLCSVSSSWWMIAEDRRQSLLSKMHWNDSSGSSQSDNETHSAFTQTEHNIVAAYLITAGMGIGKLLHNFFFFLNRTRFECSFCIVTAMVFHFCVTHVW